MLEIVTRAPFDNNEEAVGARSRPRGFSKIDAPCLSPVHSKCHSKVRCGQAAGTVQVQRWVSKYSMRGRIDTWHHVHNFRTYVQCGPTVQTWEMKLCNEGLLIEQRAGCNTATVQANATSKPLPECFRPLYSPGSVKKYIYNQMTSWTAIRSQTDNGMHHQCVQPLCSSEQPES